jgi:hypothetical protein
MEARLHAYFSVGLVSTWQLYSYGIGRFLGSYGAAGARSLFNAWVFLEHGGKLIGTSALPGWQ